MTKLIFENDNLIIEDSMQKRITNSQFGLFLNILLAVIFMADSDKPIEHWYKITWMVIGVTAITCLIIQRNRVAINKIELKSIQQIKEGGNFFTGYKLIICLENKKRRPIVYKKEKEFEEVIELLKSKNYEIS